MRSSQPSPPGIWGSRLWPLGFWAVGLLMAFHPMILSGFHQMQADPGDTRLNHYILEHGFRWLTGDSLHARFWNPPFFYPQANVAAYTDVLVGAAPLYWLWRGLGVDPDSSFQFWMLSVMSLNFLAAYLWLRRGLRSLLRLEPLAASVGAFIFAYASARVAQIGHQQLLPHFYTIAALYALTRILSPAPERDRDSVPAIGSRTRTAWIVVLFASVTLQLYAGFYLGWFLLLALAMAALWLILLAAVSRDFRLRTIRVIRRDLLDHWKVILGAAITSAALLAPMALHYLSAGQEVGYRDFEGQTIRMMPRVLSWFNLGWGSWLYDWQAGLAHFSFPEGGEHKIGLGLVTTLSSVAGLVLGGRRHHWLRFIAVCAFTIGAAMTVFPGGLTVWRYLHTVVPGGDAIRALARVGLLMLIPAALGVAFTIQWILNRAPSAASATRPTTSTRSVALALSLALVCVAEQGRTTVHYDKFKRRAQVESIVRQIGSGSACEAFFFSPLMQPGQRSQDWKYQVDAMWAQMLSGVPTVNGYSGNAPPGWDLDDNRIRNPVDEARIRGALDRWAAAKRLDPARICWIRMPMGD